MDQVDRESARSLLLLSFGGRLTVCHWREARMLDLSSLSSLFTGISVMS